MSEVRLAIVDDHPTLLAGLAALLDGDPRYRIVGTGEQATDAVALLKGEMPDVMLLDLSMPGDIYSAIRTIADTPGAPRMLIFTAFADVNMAMRALEAGASGFVLKGSPVRDLHDAIAAASRGQRYVSAGFSEKLDAAMRNRDATKLSVRERQLVDCLLRGMSNRDIADALSLTEKTVKHYMTNVMNKLNAKSRLEVAVVAKRLGLGSADALSASAEEIAE